MPFDDDSRWDEVIAMMNWLSLQRYTGMVRFSLVNGRIHRRTVDDMRCVVSLVKESQQKREEAMNA
jgi:hypothetical protein